MRKRIFPLEGLHSATFLPITEASAFLASTSSSQHGLVLVLLLTIPTAAAIVLLLVNTKF